MKIKYEFEQVHKDEVRPGDIIVWDDNAVTVCEKDIRYCSFMGTTIFGDSLHLGTRPVTRLKYQVPPTLIESQKIAMAREAFK